MVMHMVTKEDRARENLAGSESNIFQKMLDQITDFATNLLNLKPKEAGSEDAGEGAASKAGAIPNDILAKAKDLSKNAVKSIVSTGDSVLKSIKLDENETVKKMQQQAKDFLKQMGLLEEEFENEDYY
jgi:hypothetical protein